MKRAVTTGVFMTYALLCNAAAAHAGVATPAVEWHDRAAAAAVLLDRQWGTGQESSVEVNPGSPILRHPIWQESHAQ